MTAASSCCVLVLWALRNPVSRWHGPAGTKLKGHPRAEALAEPVPQEPGLLGSRLSWQSPRSRLAPLPPPRAAGQPRAVWLPPLEERRSQKGSSSSGSNRPGVLVPPGPSGEPLPHGTTARGRRRAGRAPGQAHFPGQPTRPGGIRIPSKLAARMGWGWGDMVGRRGRSREPGDQGEGAGVGAGLGEFAEPALTRTVFSLSPQHH